MKRIALALLFGLATQAQANLLDRGNGLIYHTDLNITWMDDPEHGDIGAMPIAALA